ncbi:hypothetical protein ACH4GP_03895, partial [Streptomyces celluloflavus]
MIKTLGNMADRLQAAAPENKAPLYANLSLELKHHANQRVMTLRSQPADMCILHCVSEGGLELSTRAPAHNRSDLGKRLSTGLISAGVSSVLSCCF